MLNLNENNQSASRGKALSTLLKNKELIIDASILFFIVLFLLDYFEPRYLFSKTITTGGDTASHYYTAQYLRDHLLPHGKISGWTQGNYAGFPILQFYFPLPFLLMVGLSYVIPLQIAFKVVSVLGIFLLPCLTYVSLRLMRLAFPAPIIGALFTLPFLFMEANSMWGGNINSTLAGEIAYSFGFSLTILLFGALYHDISARKHPLRHAILVFFIGFSHGYTLLFAGLVSSFFLWTTQDFLKKFLYLFKIYLLGFCLLGFWIIPLLSYLPFTTAYNFLWVFNSISEIFPKILYPFLLLTLAGLGIEFYQCYKSRKTDMATWFIWYWILLSVLCFFSAFKLGVVDIRFLPFLQISIFILAAIGLYRLIEKAQAKSLFAVLVFLVTILWTDHNTQGIQSWIAWNYSGFEAKTLWPQFSQVNQVLKGSPNDPRVVFEHSDVHNNAGTTRAFESLPLFAGRSTLEGLYMQASPTAPFVFDIQSEISDEISCPFPNYACSRHDIDRGIKHLQMFNVSDYVVVSDLVKSELKKHPDFRLKASIPPYEVYELKTNENRYVVPLKYEPVLMQTKDWKSAAYRWFKDFRNNDVHLVFPVGASPDDLKRFKTVIDGNVSIRLPKIPIDTNGEIKETVLDDEILIDTSLIHQPLLVKVSYHPNWKVEGADKVFLASPSFMLIYPNQSHVRLYYGKSRPEFIGQILSILGLATLLLGIPFVRSKIPVSLVSNPWAGVPTYNLAALAGKKPYLGRVLKYWYKNKNALVVGVAVVFFSSLFAVIFLNKGEDAQSLLRDGILLKDLKEFPQARDNFKKVLDKYPTAGVADQAGYYFAITYYMEDRCEETITGFQDLIRKYPESVWVPEAYYHLGLCNTKLHKIVAANDDFKYVIDQFPTTAWAERARERFDENTPSRTNLTGDLFSQAIAHFNQDQCSEVIQLVEKLRAEQPEFAKMDQALGIEALCLFKQRHYDETIELYVAMLKQYPTSPLAPEAYYHIALSSQYLEKKKQASNNYNIVIQKYPETEWATHSAEALKSLQ